MLWTGDWLEDPGDQEILSRAYKVVLEKHHVELFDGANITAEPGRLRIRST